MNDNATIVGKTMTGYTYAQWHKSNRRRPTEPSTFERIDKRLVTYGGITRVRNVWRMASNPDNAHEYIRVGGYFQRID